MKWVQNDYQKSIGVERYFLDPSDEHARGAGPAWHTEWFATVMLCDDRTWVATIEPEDEARYREAYEEYFPTREAAQRWAELEMKLDNKI